MPLNLQALRAFAAVVEHASFSRAALALRVSQPAVSRAVAVLEREAGAALLERLPRTVRVTEAGAALYAHARVIFGAERTAEEELHGLRGLDRAALHIGASTTIATYLLPPLLAAFAQAHPNVALRVTSANTHDVAALLLEHAVDVALVEGPVRDRRIVVAPWRADELVVICGRHHALAARKKVPTSALAAELFILRESGSGTRDVVDEALRRHRLAFRRTLEVGSTEAIKQTVAAGLGISIVSAAAAADQIALGKLCVVDATKLRMPRVLSRLTLEGRRASFAAQAFSRLLDASAEAPSAAGRSRHGSPTPATTYSTRSARA